MPVRRGDSLRFVAPLVLVLTFFVLWACKAPAVEAISPRPNVIWIVWDTVRADRMSLYGHSTATTPNLDNWAKGARVYDNVVSTASTTTPAHAAMLTGLLPSQHGANNSHRWLEDSHVTLAELLRAEGYATYLWAANPHISSVENFQQGFGHEAHPWDETYRERAIEIVTEKARGDFSSELGHKIETGDLKRWAIKAAGELAEEDFLAWLQDLDGEAPFFAFLNYMEAHRPFIPSRDARQRVMTPQQVEASFRVDRSWVPMWSYTFGLKNYTLYELDLIARTYDATLTELDELFAHLLESLEKRDLLANTVVVLTADHGEHLGEHHMMDHQYSLYGPAINVPLLLHYPARVEPGRDARPVMNYDLFPTILELVGLEPPPGLASRARSLLAPASRRVRVAEYPAVFEDPLRAVHSEYPSWDPSPFSRRLRAYHDHPYKLIWGEDGRHELYQVERDPLEMINLAGQEPATTKRMVDSLERIMGGLERPGNSLSTPTEPSAEHMKMLEGLGYVIGDDDAGVNSAESRDARP
jgi:arylsulfatase A-like enzyme